MQVLKIKGPCLKTLMSPCSVPLFCVTMVAHQGALDLICLSHSTPRLCQAEVSSPSESFGDYQSLDNHSHHEVICYLPGLFSRMISDQSVAPAFSVSNLGWETGVGGLGFGLGVSANSCSVFHHSTQSR